MFALLALGGDIGSSSGPTLVGIVSDIFSGNLKMGILAASIFPILLLVGAFLCKKFMIRNNRESLESCADAVAVFAEHFRR